MSGRSRSKSPYSNLQSEAKTARKYKIKKTGEVLRENRNIEKRRKCGEVQQREKKEKNLYSKEKGKKIKFIFRKYAKLLC